MEYSLFLVIFIILILVAYTIKKEDMPPEPSPQPEPEPEPHVPEPEPEPELKTKSLNMVNNLKEDSMYGRVMSYTRRTDQYHSSRRSTNAHESAHGLHSHLGNVFRKELFDRDKVNHIVNCFYVDPGSCVRLIEPKTLKSTVARFVPKSLRWKRYGTYVVGQRGWNDQPLYLCDEYACYIVGSTVSIEDHKAGKINGWQDGISGAVEFSVYCTALCMSVKENDPEWWEGEYGKNFRLLMKKYLKDTKVLYDYAKKTKELYWDELDSFMNELYNNPDAEAMRQFMKTELSGALLEVDVK